VRVKRHNVSGCFYVHRRVSQEFLGFEWQSVYYVYTTLNFGMKVGAVHLHVLLEEDGRFSSAVWD
jgi:hypothetical protein